MTLTRLYRPCPPDDFPAGIVALHDDETNVVTFNREVFDLKRSSDFGMLFRLGIQDHHAIVAE